MNHDESRLHIAVVDYLRGEIRKGKNVIKVQRPFDCMFLHPVNEFKDETEAFWGTRKGILPGAADLLFWWNQERKNNDTHISNFLPHAGAIELKTTASLTSNQIKFKQCFIDMGGKWALCKKVAEVRDTLIEWGLVCKNMHALEPSLSLEEKKRMNTEWQRPR